MHEEVSDSSKSYAAAIIAPVTNPATLRFAPIVLKDPTDLPSPGVASCHDKHQNTAAYPDHYIIMPCFFSTREKKA